MYYLDVSYFIHKWQTFEHFAQSQTLCFKLLPSNFFDFAKLVCGIQ